MSRGTRLFPDVVVFSCDHEMKVTEIPFIDYIEDKPIANNPKLVPEVSEIFKSLVVHNLVDPPSEKATLRQVCPHCIPKVAFTKWKGDWLEVLLDPLSQLKTVTHDRVTLVLIFRQIWYMLTQDKYLDHWCSSDAAPDGAFAFRLWCKTVALRLSDASDRNTRTRFLAVIQDLYGPLVFQEARKVMAHYQRQLPFGKWSVEQVWPGTGASRDSHFLARVEEFRRRARGPHAAYPVDLSREFHEVCLAGSSFGAELLGPPQKGDLRLEVLGPEAAKSKAVSQRDIDHLLELIETLNVETMKFKVRLFRLFRRAADTKALADGEQVQGVLDLVESLEERRARVISPLKERLRRSWDAWVDFAKPFADGLEGQKLIQAPRRVRDLGKGI
ncbi:hypothetical protein PG985_010514 [Apiospora marii]|uniref:Uncharacterized protein n=1 Tax=Apiospora marii TaxID=335849 RepID=A0ABR1T2M8_9PEZI